MSNSQNKIKARWLDSENRSARYVTDSLRLLRPLTAIFWHVLIAKNRRPARLFEPPDWQPSICSISGLSARWKATFLRREFTQGKKRKKGGGSGRGKSEWNVWFQFSQRDGRIKETARRRERPGGAESLWARLKNKFIRAALMFSLFFFYLLKFFFLSSRSYLSPFYFFFFFPKTFVWLPSSPIPSDSVQS